MAQGVQRARPRGEAVKVVRLKELRPQPVAVPVRSCVWREHGDAVSPLKVLERAMGRARVHEALAGAGPAGSGPPPPASDR